MTGLVINAIGPGPSTFGALMVLFACLCYSVVNVNYGAFSICARAYIAFLLAFAGLPENEIASYRVANTALGGSLALLAPSQA